jgi:hypothetical protein
LATYLLNSPEVKRQGRALLSLSIVAFAVTLACAPAVKRLGGAPTPAQMAEFWIDPGGTPRDLFAGPGGNRFKSPPSDAPYDIDSYDTSGFSITYKVLDAQRTRWNVKVGPEAQTEVVSSRIAWALGYHELPSYFVERWIAVDDQKHGVLLGGARFRPHEIGLKSKGEWSWQENAFVGTRPYQGLLALMMILNSTDLKSQNNAVYEVVGAPREGARRWFVVKDLGASLGETGRMDPRRGYIEGFEREPFITGVDKGWVQFGFRGRHQELLDRIGVEDVRWICQRLKKITDRQWHDAFRAGNYTSDLTARYLARIREKIDDGLRLP